VRTNKQRKCATCGKRLGSNYHLMYDAKQNKAVPVCRDDRACQKPYVKKITACQGGEAVNTVNVQNVT